jgi:hypothetical protein
MEEKIDSVAQMEALMLLRANASASWKLQELAQRLYLDEPQTAVALSRLVVGGPVSATQPPDPLFRYWPASPEVASMADRVAQVYTKHLVPVTNLIHSKPRTRVQEFADAFRFRKEE